MKKFFGGIFVLLHVAIGLFYCFEGLITPVKPSIGVIISVWCLFSMSAIMYPLGKSVYKTQDFTMIAGYDPRKHNYNKPVFAEFFRQVTIWCCFFGFFFSTLYRSIPFLERMSGSCSAV